MKTNKILQGITLCLTLVFLATFSACEKDEPTSNLQAMLQQYPAEVTMENWEEFVYAPQEVIDYHEQKAEGQQQAATPTSNSETFRGSSCDYQGWVKVWSNGWTQMARTQVDARTSFGGNLLFATTTNTATPYNWCKNGGTTITKFRWFYKRKNATYPRSDWVRGVSGFDLIRIQQHLLAIHPFTSLREYIAADADRNGVVNSVDKDLLSDLILGQRQNLPAGSLGCTGRNQPFQYVEASDYINFDNEPNHGLAYLGLIYTTNCPEFYPDPVTNQLADVNANAIKRGDVTGNWTP